jgi:hypothetical protein
MEESRIPLWRDIRTWAAGSRSLADGLSRRFYLLESEALCAEARRRTGLEDFGDPPVEPALSILVNSLELQADLHPLGRFLLWVHLRGLLETRLRLTQTWREHLEIMSARFIERPVFITGMPRSGSTFLHERYKGRRQGSALRDRGLGEILDRYRLEAYCSRFEVPVGDHNL